jgi:hypothetical protein
MLSYIRIIYIKKKKHPMQNFLKFSLIKIYGVLHVYLPFSEVCVIVRINSVYFLRTALIDRFLYLRHFVFYRVEENF